MQTQQTTNDMHGEYKSEWPDWSMAPTINARYQGTEITLENSQLERELLYKELCYMSAVSRFMALDDAVCGS